MRKIAALAVGVALLLAGCSGDSTDTAAPDATSGAQTETTKDDAIAALVPEAIASRGTLVVGAELTYAPAEFLDEDGTTPVGYDVDLAKAIGDVLGLKAEVQASSFDAIIPGIGSKYDVGISSFTINPERLDQVNMIKYFEAGSAYAVVAGNPAGVDPTNLCGLTIGVQTGTVQDQEIEDTLAPACASAGEAAPSALPYEEQSAVTNALIGGKADVMYADSPIVAYAVEQTDGKIEQLGDIVDTAPQGIVVSKSDEALTDAIQKATQKIIDDGTYLKILTKWRVETGAVTTAELNPTVG